ncbi:hypothetical protein [Ruegeria sp.]|uniref:hypothetical protein n=1 Tax=Ruegeria sp. TaxID=1879320 RepID=UPI003AFF9BB4
MPTAPIIRNKPSGTFLTHLFGSGLEADTRYVVERFRSMSKTGEIRPVEAGQKKRETLTRAAIHKLRPARNEIIICTARADSKSGCQLWGSIASGLFFAAARKA